MTIKETAISCLMAVSLLPAAVRKQPAALNQAGLAGNRAGSMQQPANT